MIEAQCKTKGISLSQLVQAKKKHNTKFWKKSVILNLP